MPKLSFSDILALLGIAAGIVLIVLDKAGKLTGWRLLLFLSIAAALTLPAVLSWSWVSDAQGLAKFSRVLLLVCVVGAVYSLLAVWVSPDAVKPSPSSRIVELLVNCRTDVLPFSVASKTTAHVLALYPAEAPQLLPGMTQ